MSAAVLLERLQRVSQHGPDRWRAVCPAHESKRRTQSLAIREMPDGTVLIRCFAGCGAADIVAAVDLELRDLFPGNHSAPAGPRNPQRARMYHATREAVQTLQHEALVCAIAAEDVAAGHAITQDDAARVALAAGRIRAAVEACT